MGITFEPFEMSYDMTTKETKTKFTFEATYLGWTAAFSLEIPVPGFLEDLGFPQNAFDALPAFAKEWWFME